MVYKVKEMYTNNVQLQSYLKLVTGVDYINNMTYTLDQIFTLMDRDAENFSATRTKYLIYQ